MNHIRKILTALVAAASCVETAWSHELIYKRAFAAPSEQWARVAGVGDVNGDAVPDFAVTAPNQGDGVVLVISGASKLALHTLVGDAQAPQLGQSLAAVGDLDQDGVGDLVVGATGSVRVFSLGTGLALYTIPGVGSGFDLFGNSVAGVGDVDLDGRADFAVGATQYFARGYIQSMSGPGFVQVFSGASGSLIRTIIGPANLAAFGGSIANGGDLDGDGIDDMLVSHTAKFGTGTVGAYSGATGGLLFSVPHQDSGGAIVTGMGDVDADGMNDFAVGYFNRVAAISGGSGATLYSREGILGDRLGCSLAKLGDLDGDGAADFIVGAMQVYTCTGYCGPFTPPSTPGYANVLSGRTGSVLETLVGDSPNQRFGAACAALGDLDGDGKPEFMVTNMGPPTVRIFSGRAGVSTPQRYCAPYGSAFATIGFTGTTSIAQNQLGVTLTGATTGVSSILFCGPSAASIQIGWPFGSVGGYLCVGSPLRRVGLPQPISAGSSSVAVDLGPTSPFTNGSTWYFQFAYSTTSGLRSNSDALAVTFTP